MLRSARCSALAACAAVLVLPAAARAADTLYAVTDDNAVITLNSSAPGNVERRVPIAGLPAGEKILGIDVRPSDGALMALGSTSRIYELDPVTGFVSTVGADNPFTPLLNGNSFGFNVNPVADRLRIVSDLEQNLRVSPDTGQIAAADPPLTYATGDPGAGANPTVGSVAFSNSTRGATVTTAYGIDSARDVLVTLDPANTGTVNTVGPLGVDAGEPVAFDITSENVAYAAFRPAGQTGSELYTVNLQTGRATPAAKRPIIGTEPIRALAAAGPVAGDTTAPQLSVAFSSTQLEDRLLSGGVVFSASCDEDCTLDSHVSINGHTGGTTDEQRIAGRAGRRTVTIALDPTARRQIQRPGNVLLRLSVSASDSAGNTTSEERVSRTQTLSQRHG